jgi:hypothetical protein
MASVYPGALPSNSTKEDNVDVYAASHINKVQEDTVAIATELGTDVAGDQTDLKTRLSRSLNDSGGMRKGTSFPVSPTPLDGDFFYRTDVDTVYVYNGVTWLEAVSGPSALFSAYMSADSSSTGEDQSANLADREQTGDAAWKDSTVSETTPTRSRVKKIRAVASRGKLIYVMIGIGLAVLGLIFSFLSGALGIVQIKENLVSKMSQRAADALDNRKNRIMAKKFSKDLTSGSCTVIKVKCRYRGFTNRELKKFNTRAQKAGLTLKL